MSGQHPKGGALRRPRAAWTCVVAALGATALTSLAADYFLLGQEAPDFALRAVESHNMRLSEQRGQVVVLAFWGSRCGPCGAQLEALDRSYDTYRSAGLQIMGVNVDDDQVRALEAARAHDVAFAMLLDPDKRVSRTYRVDNLPMTVLIDRNGTVRYVQRDYNSRSHESYLQHLRELLNE